MFNDFFTAAVAFNVRMMLMMINAFCWQNTNGNLQKYDTIIVHNLESGAQIYAINVDSLAEAVQANMLPTFGKHETANILDVIKTLSQNGKIAIYMDSLNVLYAYANSEDIAEYITPRS